MAIIKLTRGKVAIIDDADLSLVAGRSWHATERQDGNGWYAKSTGGTRMHRLLLGVFDERIVDHKNGDGLDNRRDNIRIGTQSNNCVNRKTTPGNHLRGTRLKKGRWQAYIKYKGKQRSLGYFDTEESAHFAYITEATKLHGDWMPLPAAPAMSKETTK